MKIKDSLIKFACFLAFLLVFIVIIYILYFIFSRGIRSVDFAFLTRKPKGVPIGSSGGIGPAIIGSLLIMIISMLISGVFAISCAFYNVIFCKSKFINLVIRIIVRCASSVPSILFGLFVYGFFIVNLNIEKSLLTACITISIMIFPFIEIRVEKVIDELDKSNINDSLAMGIDKSYMCKNLIIPMISKELISILILAGSYGIGATAPLLLTGSVIIAEAPDSILKPVMTLPTHLHMLLNQSMKFDKAFATASVLIIIVILSHAISELISKKIGE